MISLISTVGSTKLNYKNILDTVTATAAFVAMGLGLYNFIVEKNKAKVKVRVVPKAIKQRFNNAVVTTINEFPLDHIDSHFALEVSNLSLFQIFISEVGFYEGPNKYRFKIIGPLADTFSSDPIQFPKKLEARESITMYCRLHDILTNDNSYKIKSAFVETTCGAVFKGKSKALSEMLTFIRTKR